MKTLLLSLLLPLSLFAQNATNKDESNPEFQYDQKSKSVIPRYLGKVTLIKGKVTNQKNEILKKNSKVYPQDKLTTDKKGFVKLEMVDTTSLTLAPNSTLSFQKWKYRTKSDREAIFDLEIGRMRAHFKVKAENEDDLKVKVGHVSMGIRGTEISVNHLTTYDQKGEEIKVAHLATLSGKTLLYDEVKEEEIVQNEGEYYISYMQRDGKVIKAIKHQLLPNEWDELKAIDKNPNKYFKPFLSTKGLKTKNQSQTKSKEMGQGSSQRRQKGSTSPKPSWKETLKKLNGRLKGE